MANKIKICLSINKSEIIKNPLGDLVLGVLGNYNFVRSCDIMIIPTTIKLRDIKINEIYFFNIWLNRISNNIDYILINLKS